MPPKRRLPQEFIADIRIDDDGIRPLRRAHRWSTVKLGVLHSYLNAYARACSSAPATYFVDAMAGPGMYEIEETGEHLLGSTPIALGTIPRLTKCLAVEYDRANKVALQTRTAAEGGRVEVAQGDCNAILRTEMQKHIPRNRPTFVLLDPEGTELRWETIRDAALHRQGDMKCELLILFATNGVNRMLPVESEIDERNARALDSMFPPRANWRHVWRQRRTGEILPPEARELYVNIYADGLRELGYTHVFERPVTMSPQGRPIYHLIFATDHPIGAQIMTDVFEHMTPDDDQLRLDF